MSDEVDPMSLWLGVALGTLVLQANQGDALARRFLPDIPESVKRLWPGTFTDYPYEGEPPEEHAERKEGCVGDKSTWSSSGTAEQEEGS